LKRGGSEDPAVIQTYFTSESKVAYSCVAKKRETKCRIVIVSLVIKKRTITRESDDGSLGIKRVLILEIENGV
jgi:hypothetical protein